MTRIMNPPVSELGVPVARSRTIQSVDRAAALLKAIADSSRPPTVVELAETCMLNRSTAWRLLATLDAHGLIERDPVSQRYSLGYAFLRIAAGADVDPLVCRARPVLEQLARDTAEATNLAVVKRFNLVYVDQVDPPQIMAPNWFGRPVPLHATSTGKAYLAFLPPEERRRRCPSGSSATRNDDHRPAPLGAELEEVRRDGLGGLRGKLKSRSSAPRLPCCRSKAGPSRCERVGDRAPAAGSVSRRSDGGRSKPRRKSRASCSELSRSSRCASRATCASSASVGQRS